MLFVRPKPERSPYSTVSRCCIPHEVEDWKTLLRLYAIETRSPKNTVVFWITLGLPSGMKREELRGTRTLRSPKHAVGIVSVVSMELLSIVTYFSLAGREGEPMYKRGHKRLNIERF